VADGGRDHLAYHLVGVAKRHAAAHQVVGEVGGGGVAVGGRGAHSRTIEAGAGKHGDVDVETVVDGVDGVEHRLLVFLVVAVVGERLALHQGQQRDQVAGDAPGLAAHQLGGVRILLLRHDARAGTEVV